MLRSWVTVPTFILLASGLGAADEWQRLTKEVLAALSSGNDRALEVACKRLVADNTSRVVEFGVKSIQSATPSQYWTLVISLSQLSDDVALSSLSSEILNNRSPELRRDLMLALRWSESENVKGHLLRILQNGTQDLQSSAIDEIVTREAVEGVPVLIEMVNADQRLERELSRRCLRGIRSLAKEDPPGHPSTWKLWWESRAQAGVDQPYNPRRRGVGETVVDSLERRRLTDYEDLKKWGKGEILVVQGASDSVQDVLFRLGINYSIASYESVSSSNGVDLSTYKAVFINCGTADWPPKQAERVRRFVEAGGYLFVTDIGMMQVIRPSFPGVIDFGKGTHGDAIVDILPARGSTGHPLLRGVDPFVPVQAPEGMGGRMKWTIDAGGPAIQYDPKRAVALIEAPELAKRRKPSAVAITFLVDPDVKLIQEGLRTGGVYEEFQSMKGGRVVCVLSHFSKQRDRQDGFVLQNLLINFLIEAGDRARINEARAKSKGATK